jgi:succinate dehydrogenase/fumarate reductase flavoprotein subunit
MDSTTKTISEPSRATPVWGEFDVVVLGGGPAGIAAACAASRLGQNVLLIENYGFLGGMGTAAGVTNFCGLHANVHGTVRQVVYGVADDLLARMHALGGLNHPHLLFGGRIAAQAYDNAVYKVAADELLLASGVKILFHALAVGVVMHSAQSINALLIETKSGRFAVRAQCFIDCSGDGDLAAFASVPFEKGDDGKSMMYPTTMFRVNGVDAAKVGQSYLYLDELMVQAEAKGQRFARKMPIVRPQKHNSEWRANVTQLSNADGSPVDGTNAAQLSDAEIQGRKQAVDFFKFLRSSVPGFDQSYLLELAPQLGIRETRRIIGHYQLTERDVLDSVSFEDTIGVNGWMIEEHVAGSVSFVWPETVNGRGFNHLPYRMLLPLQVDNLLVAGRCACMTHMGQSAARVSGGCFVMGQAAGTAAALVNQKNLKAAELSTLELQRQLERDGVFLGTDVGKLPHYPSLS